MRDRKIRQRRVRLARRHVVVAVHRPREVRRADRLTQEAQPDSLARVEQLGHDRIALRRVVDEPRRRVGERRAEARHGLVGRRRIDGDRLAGRARARGEHGACLRCEQLALVGGGLPDRDGGPGCGIRRVGEHDRSGDKRRDGQCRQNESSTEQNAPSFGSQVAKASPALWLPTGMKQCAKRFWNGRETDAKRPARNLSIGHMT